MLIGAGNTRQPMPEMLGRRDGQPGAWQIDACDPVRGQPFTNIVERVMAVPMHDEDTARCIRAHEMMHARVSPIDGFATWVQREVATVTALQVSEEVRVNLLCERAGFDVKKHLVDGSEIASGERLAQQGDWAGAVYTAVAYANTGSLNPFLTGIRRTQPEWAKALRAVADRVVRELKKVSSERLGSTRVDENSGLAPLGFVYTEQIAEMIDRIANPPEPEVEPEPDGKPAPQGQDEAEAEKAEPGKRKRTKPTGNKPPVDPEQIKKIRPANGGKRPLRWPELRVERCPLGRRAPGGLGKKRRPAAVGRNPRRVHRMITDPDRRIFDAKTKGNGGVVLIDGSASVNFSEADISRILEAAPGATVAVYSARSFEDEKNLWVLADKGRMVTHLPERKKANGVDYPALVWAIDRRQHATAPVVWVTDGMVHPPSGGSDGEFGAVNQCIKTAIAGKVIVRQRIDEAVEVLTDLGKGRRIKMRWPSYWQQVYRHVQGKPLPTGLHGR